MQVGVTERIAPLQSIVRTAPPAPTPEMPAVVRSQADAGEVAAATARERSEVARREQELRDRAAAEARGARATLVGPDHRSLDVRYALDEVTNRWVASVVDSTSGEVVRSVPPTRVLHQLAELGRRSDSDSR